MCTPERNFQVIKFAPGVEKPEAVVIKREKCDAVPSNHVDNCDVDVDIAQPTKDEIIDLITCDHWADVAVVAESDDENANSRKVLSKTTTRKTEKLWYMCLLCNYRSELEEPFMKHLLRKHTSIYGDFFKCGFCKRMYQTEDRLQKHVINHKPEKQFVDDSWKSKLGVRGFGNLKRHRLTKNETAILEEVFKNNQYIQGETKLELARRLNVGANTVQRWFKRKRRSVREK